jgi:hypothetical protein
VLFRAVGTTPQIHGEPLQEDRWPEYWAFTLLQSDVDGGTRK